MNRYAILNVDKGQFLTPLDGTDVFKDRVELAEFLSEQKKLHNLDSISHLRVLSVLIDRETDIDIADVVEESEHLENQAYTESVLD